MEETDDAKVTSQIQTHSQVFTMNPPILRPPKDSSLDDPSGPRTLGFFGATGVGVGAIVGGGILALAGTAFATTGPSAVVAFTLNGLIALLTALTFAEMATSFPESGGTYTFAKKVLSVEAAFMVGWVVWFASIVAAVLYALGFGAFAGIFLERLWLAAGSVPPAWLGGHALETFLALLATVFYAVRLVRSTSGGGNWETVGKMVVFLVLILGGLWAAATKPVEGSLTPFFARGGLGLVQAMGYTFIALQGFDLIAAVGGKVKEPRRNLPRAMVGSLVIAFATYIPLLLIVATVGVQAGSDITTMSRNDPEGVVVTAVENYLGPAGLWLVLVAALLAMLSALQANLLAASHIALAMARDRNLPGRLQQLHGTRGTPVAAVLATSVTAALLLLAIPDLAVAGAVSSLIFLVSFTLAHWTSILTRRRGGGDEGAFLLPFFPLIPVVGGGACLALAVFQGIAVPTAGLLGMAWLVVGGGLYLSIFSHRARVADASAEARDPHLARLRGRNPLVLVPIANPASAASLVTLANALAPSKRGRVLLLSVVRTPEIWQPGEVPPQLAYAQEVLGEALTASFAARLAPEALTTVSPEPWEEIVRVAQLHRCESLLLGLGSFEDASKASHLEKLLHEVDSNVVLLRIPTGWQPQDMRRVLVPVGGRRDQSYLRARLLGSLGRAANFEVIYLEIVPTDLTPDAATRLEHEVQKLADDESPGNSRVEIVRREDVGNALVERACDVDLVILGLQRRRRTHKMLGEIPERVARESGCGVLLISQRR